MEPTDSNPTAAEIVAYSSNHDLVFGLLFSMQLTLEAGQRAKGLAYLRENFGVSDEADQKAALVERDENSAAVDCFVSVMRRRMGDTRAEAIRNRCFRLSMHAANTIPDYN